MATEASSRYTLNPYPQIQFPAPLALPPSHPLTLETELEEFKDYSIESCTQKLFEELIDYVNQSEKLKDLTTDNQTLVVHSLGVLMLRLMDVYTLENESTVAKLHENHSIFYMLENINTLLHSIRISDEVKAMALKQLCCHGGNDNGDSSHFKVNQIARANITLVLAHAEYTEELQKQLSELLSNVKKSYQGLYAVDYQQIKGSIEWIDKALCEELGIQLTTNANPTSQAATPAVGISKKVAFLETPDDSEKVYSINIPPVAFNRRSLNAKQQRFIEYVRHRISPSFILLNLAYKIKKDQGVCSKLDQQSLASESYSISTSLPYEGINFSEEKQLSPNAPLLTMPDWVQSEVRDGSQALASNACQCSIAQPPELEDETGTIRFPISVKQLAIPAPYCFMGQLPQSGTKIITAETPANDIFKTLSVNQIHYCLAQNILARRIPFSAIVKTRNMAAIPQAIMFSLGNLYFGSVESQVASKPRVIPIVSLKYVELHSLPADISIAFLSSAMQAINDLDTLNEFLVNSQLNSNKLKPEVLDGLVPKLTVLIGELHVAKKINADDILTIISKIDSKSLICFIVGTTDKFQTRDCEKVRLAAINRQYELKLIKRPNQHGIVLNAITSFMFNQLHPEVIKTLFTTNQLAQRLCDYCAKQSFSLRSKETEEKKQIKIAMEKLLVLGVDCQEKVKIKNNEHETMFITAVKSNNLLAVKVIGKYKKTHSIPTIPSSSGFYPLTIAAYTSSPDMITLLISLGEDINFPDEKGYYPIQRAIIANKADHVRAILKAESFNKTIPRKSLDGSIYPLVHFAAKQGSTAVLQTLIESGKFNDQLETHSVGKHQLTPYLTAAVYGQIKCMKVLVTAGAKTDTLSLSRKQQNALELAVENGRLDVVKHLLCTPPFDTNKYKIDALFSAVEYCKKDILVFVISQLPDDIAIPKYKEITSIQSFASQTYPRVTLVPLLQAMPNLGVREESKASSDAYHSVDGKRAVDASTQVPHDSNIDAKINVILKPMPGTNPSTKPLYKAISDGDAQKTEALLADFTVSIPLSETDNDGRHLIQVAIDSGHHHLIPILVKCEFVPMNIMCPYTPGSIGCYKYPLLHYAQAAWLRHPLSIKNFRTLLENSKENIDIRSLAKSGSVNPNDGLTPLHFALTRKRIEYAIALIHAGADTKSVVLNPLATYCMYKGLDPMQIAQKDCSKEAVERLTPYL
ncbi:ankyrin repeat domain-containing protein [Parashewanella spongiae]|uniref:Ankyrin repeat domain-containing protein n=1 Tax=Parashewanella spongiae TaxID=342950 RepID=A0A3A6TXY5_9GAMM|nr:ankyrin repeat domain-containing protein [Parashewanella spongiae]MCL1078941.1 ankyrin repeat domain-containing protein [Parashewanella spongiae]RJY19364.1 ankyrin repeat domain-containing protein [Parashewanella spongiae]